MKIRPSIWILTLCLLGPFLPTAGSLSAQQARQLTVGLSVGPGAVQTRGRGGSWDFGPFVGGRVEWGDRRSVASLTVDVQPFRAEGAPTADAFRAVYLLPAYAIGSATRRVGLGIGMGVFDFGAGTVADGIEVGFVTGASGSARLSGPYFIELGWKRIGNVKGLTANVWTLQLVRRWRL